MVSMEEHKQGHALSAEDRALAHLAKTFKWTRNIIPAVGTKGWKDPGGEKCFHVASKLQDDDKKHFKKRHDIYRSYLDATLRPVKKRYTSGVDEDVAGYERQQL